MPNQISGKHAFVTGMTCIQSWGFQRTAAGQRYQASCTNGSTNTTAGNIDVTGQISGVGFGFPVPTGVDLAAVFVSEHETVDKRSYSGNIRIIQTVINMNVAGNAPISWTSTFGAQGDFAESAVVGGVDATLATAPSAKDLICELGGTEIEALQTATVTLRRPQGSFAFSGSMRRTSGNLEADVAISALDKRLYEAYLVPNVLQDFELLLGAVKAFHLSKCRFQGITGVTVDRNSQAPIGYSTAGQFNAVDGTTPGFIVINDADVFGDSSP